MKTPKAAQLAIIAGGGGFLSPLSAAKAFFREWIDPTIASTITGSPVSKINSPLPSPFVNPPNFQRTTLASPGDRPAITANRLVFNGTSQCLDASAGYTYVGATRPADTFYCEAGKGPTTTGLARLPDNTWWLGGFGKKNITTQAGETFDGGPIHYSADFQTIIQEIRFQNLSLPGVGMQGITLDYTAGVLTGLIWVADPITGKIFLIDPAGPTVIRTLTFVGANGIAYDTINDQLWVCLADSITISRINKTTGATVTTIASRDLTATASQDMLFFDPSYGSAGALYITGRDNNTPGRMTKHELPLGTPVKSWFIPEIQAMEGGLHVTGTTFDCCDDEYYHNGPAGVNRVVQVIADTSSPDYGTRIVLAGVAKIAATPAATVALCHGGDSLTTAGGLKKGVGIFFSTTANQFRLSFRGSDANVIINWTITSTTTEFLYYVDINSVTGDCTLYINGVLQSTQNSALVVGALPSLVWTLGASYDGITGVAVRFAAVTIGGFIVSTDAMYRAEIEGVLNWGGSAPVDKGLLPAGHLYRLRPPV